MEGVPGAVNAWTTTDDGSTAFLWNPVMDAVVAVDTASGDRKLFLQSSKEFCNTRGWLCYCLFHSRQAPESTLNEQTEQYLVSLLYHQPSQCYYFVTFLLTFRSLTLRPLQKFQIRLKDINLQRMAYSAHKNIADNCIQVVFYEWIDRASLSSNLPSHFVFCQFDCHTMKMGKEQRGVLPEKGRWQLPFIASNNINFVKLESAASYVATLPVDNSKKFGDLKRWQIKKVGAAVNTDRDGENTGRNGAENIVQMPPKKAIWCNAWSGRLNCPNRATTHPHCSCEGAFFAVVSESVDKEQLELSLWHLNTESLQWKRLDKAVTLPLNASKFSIRVAREETQASYAIFLHCDIEDQSMATLLKFPDAFVVEKCEMPDSEEPLKSTNVVLTDVICPICLETYIDPRTLACGHSICFVCLVKMREIGGIQHMMNSGSSSNSKVKCPNCRKTTKIPASGLPTNYGLQEAIEKLARRQMDLLGLVQGVEELPLYQNISSEMAQELNESIDLILNDLKQHLTEQIDSNLIKVLKASWTIRFNELRANRIAFSAEEWTEVNAAFAEEMKDCSELVKSKTRSIIERFRRQIPTNQPPNTTITSV